MVKIRLARGGAKKRPFYSIVVTDSRKPRDSGFIERVGYFNPIAVGAELRLNLNEDKLNAWIKKGALLSDRVKQLLKEAKNPKLREKKLAKKQALATKKLATKKTKLEQQTNTKEQKTEKAEITAEVKEEKVAEKPAVKKETKEETPIEAKAKKSTDKKANPTTETKTPTKEEEATKSEKPS